MCQTEYCLAHCLSLDDDDDEIFFFLTDGKGPTHYGVASTYLESLKPDDSVLVFIRR